MVTTSQVRPSSGGTAVSPRKDEWSTLSMAGGVLPGAQFNRGEFRCVMS